METNSISHNLATPLYERINRAICSAPSEVPDSSNLTINGAASAKGEFEFSVTGKPFAAKQENCIKNGIKVSTTQIAQPSSVSVPSQFKLCEVAQSTTTKFFQRHDSSNLFNRTQRESD